MEHATFNSLLRSAVDKTEFELGSSYLEKHYQLVLAHFLRKEGATDIETEVVVPYKTSFGLHFGFGRIDILCKYKDKLHILELKAGVSGLGSSRQKAILQALRYKKHWTEPAQAHVVFFECSAMKNIEHLS